MAYDQGLLAKNPAAPRQRFDLSHSISDRSFSVVRKPGSTRVPTASEALGGTGKTRRCFRELAPVVVSLGEGKVANHLRPPNYLIDLLALLQPSTVHYGPIQNDYAWGRLKLHSTPLSATPASSQTPLQSG